MVEETKQLDKFNPKGLKVLVVDDDPLCLAALERMLRQCHYDVTTCDRVSQAISLVMESKERGFDIVISDVCSPYGDAFGLLDVVGLQLNIPVILTSTSGETRVVMKAITHGACDYLIKPLTMEVLRNIWQHVFRRRASGQNHGAHRLALIDDEITGESDDGKALDSPEFHSKKRKPVADDISRHHNNGGEVIDDISGLRRSRVHWTVQLHEIFVRAVNQLGIDEAVPKRILDTMKVRGLTRENVASHLQKYRLYLKRRSGSVPEPHPIASFQAAEDGKSGGTMQICPYRRLKNVHSPSSCLKGPSTSPLDDFADQSFKDVLNIQDLEPDPFGLALDADEEEDDIRRVKGFSWIGKDCEEDFSRNWSF